MKRDIADFFVTCPNCQKVKEKYKRPGGFTQDIPIPTWKWENANMDFMMGWPHTRRNYYSIWVIVDRWSNQDILILLKVTYSVEE